MNTSDQVVDGIGKASALFAVAFVCVGLFAHYPLFFVAAGVVFVLGKIVQSIPFASAAVMGIAKFVFCSLYGFGACWFLVFLLSLIQPQ